MWSLTEGFYFVNKVSAPAVSYRELIGDEGGSETCRPRSLEAQVKTQQLCSQGEHQETLGGLGTWNGGMGLRQTLKSKGNWECSVGSSWGASHSEP